MERMMLQSLPEILPVFFLCLFNLVLVSFFLQPVLFVKYIEKLCCLHPSMCTIYPSKQAFAELMRWKVKGVLWKVTFPFWFKLKTAEQAFSSGILASFLFLFLIPARMMFRFCQSNCLSCFFDESYPILPFTARSLPLRAAFSLFHTLKGQRLPSKGQFLMS